MDRNTTLKIDLRDLYDVIWEAMYKEEGSTRKSIGMGPYILEYLLRPQLQKKEG